MRHFLHFTTIGFLTIALLGPTARPQKPSPTKLPTVADYKPADDSCKNKVKLYAHVSGRFVARQKTARCQLSVHTCHGLEHYQSEERPNTPTICDDYYAAATPLQGFEVCCDPGSKEDKKNNCQSPSPPWFVTQDCKDLQDPEISVTPETVNVYLCGYNIFRRNKSASPHLFRDQLFRDAYAQGLRDELRYSLRRKVCCDRFREAARTGRPCNARADADCDGIPNNSDVIPDNPDLPDIDGRSFALPSPAVFDPFPTGLTDDLIMPPADQCKNCKWELIKGELKCSQDSTKPHSYDATWRCPLTGAVVNIVRLSKPGVPCGG